MDGVLKNSGSTALPTWSVTLSLGNSTLYTSWQAAFSGKTGTVVVGPGDSGALAAGAERTFGFCANGSGRAAITAVSSSGASGGGGTGGGSAVGPAGFTRCAGEGQPCNFSGARQVAYGANGKFNYKQLTGGTACSNAVFGDPIPGVAKACYTKAVSPAPGTVINTSWRFDIRGPGAASQYYFKRGEVEVFRTDDPDGYGAIERSEKASAYSWPKNSGWHGFSAHFKIKKGGGSILQVMNCDPALGCYPQLMVLYGNGTLTQAHHTNGGIIAENVGTEFTLKVRDDGNRNEVYVNGVLRRQGPHERTTGTNNFKYGIYHGKGQFMNLASGAEIEVSNVVVTDE
jgi:hypothetical protein